MVLKSVPLISVLKSMNHKLWSSLKFGLGPLVQLKRKFQGQSDTIKNLALKSFKNFLNHVSTWLARCASNWMKISEIGLFGKNCFKIGLCMAIFLAAHSSRSVLYKDICSTPFTAPTTYSSPSCFTVQSVRTNGDLCGRPKFSFVFVESWSFDFELWRHTFDTAFKGIHLTTSRVENCNITTMFDTQKVFWNFLSGLNLRLSLKIRLLKTTWVFD